MISSARIPSSAVGIARVAVLGNSLPRQCGIATFTGDLARALSGQNPSLVVNTIAMSDRDDYVYPEDVAFEIADSDPDAYALAADYVNRFGYDVLSVQHEYGIFGGVSGGHLMGLLRHVKAPIVTTLHTVLREPSPSQRDVMDGLLELSERVVVMSERAIGFLEDVHGLSADKIDLIPHGIPAIDGASAQSVRNRLAIEGPMLLTFGLLSPDKGIQYVIEAMPSIVRECPGATYVVVGATHPNVRASSGEAYRESLVSRARELGVADSVRFVDRFVALDELTQYLAAMDFYITPYLNPKQITSGTLAYAVGAGKAVISTPYTYAEELLADQRGVFVPFRDHEAIFEAVIALERDPVGRQAMGERAADYGRQMLWPEVAKKYLATFAKAQSDFSQRDHGFASQPSTPIRVSHGIPNLRHEHLVELSDDTGMLQHATFTVPNRSEGYCVDDNARALLYTALLDSLGAMTPELGSMQGRYLSFVSDAFNGSNGRFRNFMSYGREWLEEAGSEDSHGQAMWSLGAIVNRCKIRGRREAAKRVFEAGAGAFYQTTSPRTWAYAVLAANEYLRAFPHEYSIQRLLGTMAERLGQQMLGHGSDEWPWLEDSLTYANARIPQALIVAGESIEDRSLLSAGIKSLTWLMEIQTGPDGVFAPIGTNGFYVREGVRNYYDQQPIEAAVSVSACLAANRATGNPIWMEEARRAFDWFFGGNMLGQPLYDKTTGGCYDGLHEDRLNRNQGAESCLSYLYAQAEMVAALENPGVATIPVAKYELK